MVYQPRYVPGGSQVAVPASSPSPSSSAGNTRGVAPVQWVDNGNFDIGQVSPYGGYTYDGEHIVNVTAMTKEQLDAAAIELNRVIKKNAILEQQVELMLRIAKAVENPNDFLNGCFFEPFLNITEPPPYTTFLGEEFLTLAGIIAQLEAWLADLNTAKWAHDAVKDQIANLGGKEVSTPTPESLVPSEIDKVKEKVADIEQHIVPTPGTPVTPEELPDPWPPTIPEKPELEDKLYDGLDPITLLSVHRVYLLDLAAYELEKQFIMGWCLEQIRVCLRDLSQAKAPGTQEDAFKANLEGLSAGVIALEEAGVFHD